MKMRNLLAANLGIAVITCAALAGAGSERPGDVQSRNDAAVKPKGDAQLPMADRAVPAVREIDLLPDATGHMTVGLPLIDELQPGVVVNLAVDFGRAPELFVVQARHDPTPEGSWWHLVSLERELVDATFVQRNGMFAGHVRLAAEGREVSLRPVGWNRLRVIEGDPFASQCACAGGCDHQQGPGDFPDQEPMGSVAFNETEGTTCTGCASLIADIAFFITSLAIDMEAELIDGDRDEARVEAFSILAALSQLEVANTTLAMENTGLPYKVRLVFVGEVEFDEEVTGDDTLLGVFGNNGDGIIDEIHESRQLYRADNCSLVTYNPPAEGAAGIAGVTGSFNVLMASSMGYALHAHEFGHNVGMLHAYGDDIDGGFDCESSSPGDPCRMPCETLETGEYRFGWRWVGSSTTCWRTIMAYGPGYRTMNYSNPEVSVDGGPTGVEVGDPHQADGGTYFRERFLQVAGRLCEYPEIELEDGRLTAAGGRDFDGFGIAVAGDQDYFIGGASRNDIQGNDAGAAHIFAFVEDELDPEIGFWVEIGKLIPDFLRTGDRFGEAIAYDGNQLVIAAPRAGIWETQLDEDGNEVEVEVVRNAGEITVWDLGPSGEFCLKQRIQPSNLRENDWFGTSVDLIDNLLVVGCPRRDTAEEFANNVGAVYVYKLVGGEYIYELTLMGNEDAAQMGTSVAIAVTPDLEEQKRVVAGGPHAREDSGMVASWLYFGVDDTWLPLASINGVDGSEGRFGQSVDVSGDTFVIGAPYMEDGVGRVYSTNWDYSLGRWGQLQSIDFPGDEDEARFGTSVAVENNRLAIGSPRSDSAVLDRIGGVDIFERTEIGTSWILTDLLRPSGLRPGDELGVSVAMLGNLVFAGAPNADDDGILSGVVYALNVELQDCNLNGVDDAIDIYVGTEQDLNGNGIPDACEDIGCQADVNGDGLVDGKDLGLLFVAWGPCVPDTPCPYDLNNDGQVNGGDVGVFFVAWGRVCEP